MKFRNRFRFFLTVVWLFMVAFTSFSTKAQQPLNERERATYWASKGQSLMRTSQYAEAYTAFQLARSLGSPAMATLMELAKKRNINNIQLRALTAEARALATTDPTQSLRLLEYAHQQFPDSISVLKLIGEVANIPDNWYYALRSRDMLASPRFMYLLSETDKTRLYRRQGDSLTLVHVFAERFTMKVFSPDDQYVFVGNTRSGNIYALQGQKMSLIRTFNESIDNIRFSPATNPAFGSWLLVETTRGLTKLYDLQAATLSHLVVNPVDLLIDTYACSFSPGGRFLITPTGVWQLTRHQIRVVPLAGGDGLGEIPTYYSRFSNDDRYLFFTKYEDVFQQNGSIVLAQYAFSERGDSLQYVTDLQARFDMPRKLWRLFSSNSRYMTFNDSLFFESKTGKELVRPIVRPGQTQPLASLPNESPEFGSDFRFSPSNTHVLREVRDSSLNSVFQLWRLNGGQRFFIHQFTDKVSAGDDVFSPDGRYLLTRHTTTDRLWKIEADTIILIHTFKKSLRLPETSDQDGYPVGAAYFSAHSRYLLTYGATIESTDSLWQLSDNMADGLLPVHGFRNRLKEGSTMFSPDERLLLTKSSGSQPAMLWNLAEQIALRSNRLVPPVQALFSPKGNYLLTNKPNVLWRVTDRQLTTFHRPSDSLTLDNYRFSANEQYLMKSTQAQFPEDSLLDNTTVLYTLHADSLTQIRRYWHPAFAISVDSKNLPYVNTYQTGLFSPAGTQWLQSQAVNPLDKNASIQPDTLWKLTGTTLSISRQLPGSSDLYTIENPEPITLKNFSPKTLFVSWYSLPAALFSRDGRFLLTKEQGKLQFYQLKPTPVPAGSLAGQRGFPMDVSANGVYWLTGIPASYTWPENQSNPDTPDTVRLWRRVGSDQKPDWKQLATISGLYTGMNLHWQGNQHQSLFSMAGNYLLLPTTKPGLTTLYNISGDNLQPVLNLNAKLMTAVHIPPSPQNGWDAGLLYTDLDNQTYLLRHGSAGMRKLSLGFGVLERPPLFWGKQAYWVRKIDDSQQTLEILDLVSGQTLVQIPFGAVRDFTVRPNGDAWVVSTEGALLVRSPAATLRWLKQAPVAPLQPILYQTFAFL